MGSQNFDFSFVQQQLSVSWKEGKISMKRLYFVTLIKKMGIMNWRVSLW